MQRSSKASAQSCFAISIEEADRSRQRVHLQASILEQVSNAVIVVGINGEVKDIFSEVSSLLLLRR